VVLFAIIGFFVRRIFKQLDGLQTISACNERVGHCMALREAYRQTVIVETSALTKDHKELKESFEELSQCLRKFTKGECG
jgi:hypothetical protein